MDFFILLLQNQKAGKYYLFLGSIPIIISIQHVLPVFSFLIGILLMPYIEMIYKSMLYYLPFLCTVLYVVRWIVEEIWLREDKLWFGQLSYSVGCIMLLVLLLIFSTRLIKSQELIDYKKNMMLWTSLGILLFYIGTAPFWVVRSTLLEKDLDLFYTFNSIQGILCCSMYSLFTIAFICGQPK